MSKYGQYCPAAKALEILGDRWTLLIVRDMLTGIRHFNDLERGLPGISRGLLSARLRQLEQNGIIEKRIHNDSRRTTEYLLTQAGDELVGVVGALVVWGAAWAFGEPAPEDLDPVLLMWWMRNRINTERLPERRVVTQFDFRGAVRMSFWLVLRREDVTVCLTDPGYEIDVLVTADLARYFELWAGRIRYDEAIDIYGIRVEGLPEMVRAFPDWFAWSHSADDVYQARASSL